LSHKAFQLVGRAGGPSIPDSNNLAFKSASMAASTALFSWSMMGCGVLAGASRSVMPLSAMLGTFGSTGVRCENN
jgi:hypothetical protein